jgi:Spy/CpxP family protein refolding chaperone
MMLRNPAFRERLRITPEQAARIQAQQSAFAKARIRDRADVQVKRLELDELLAAEKPDHAQLEKKLFELNEAEFAMRKAALDQRLAMREALTPEQRDNLRDMVRNFHMRRMQNEWDEPGREWRGAPRQEARPAPPNL